MSGTNMTLSEYLEYAGVYEYSQDYFDMERMFMELTLVDMHLNAYDFLKETANITLGQIDHLMVESGSCDRSYASEQIFVEKGLGIVDGIKKLFTMIGKAIGAFFNKLGSIFSGGSAKSQATDKKTAELIEQGHDTLDNINRVVDVTATVQDGRDLLESIVKSGQIANGSLQRVVTRLDDMLGGGGVKLPTQHLDAQENMIRVVWVYYDQLAKTIPNFPKFDYDEAKIAHLVTLCSSSYEVECLEFIADMEKVVDKLNTLLDIKGEDLVSDDTYNSFWKIMNTHGPEGMFERIDDIREEVLRMTKRNKKMLVNDEILAQKRETASKMEKLFGKLASISDVGQEVGGNVKDLFTDRIIANDPQTRRREQQESDFNTRYSRDKSVYSDRGVGVGKLVARPLTKTLNASKNKTYYLRFLREIYQLGVDLQRVSADSIKLLTDHINMRNDAIRAKSALTDEMAKIIEDVDKIMQSEREKAKSSGETSNDGSNQEGGDS